MIHNVDRTLFRRLAELDPQEVCTRALCSYNVEGKVYSLSFWGDEYRLNLTTEQVERVSGNLPEPHEYFAVFLVNYLMQAQDRPLSGEWISEKDISGGVAFFRGPHEIPTRLISSRFKNDLAAFGEACLEYGGEETAMADMAYSFKATANISFVVLYWQGDHEFPAEAKLLFDSSISGHLALDTIYALAVDICARMGAESSTS